MIWIFGSMHGDKDEGAELKKVFSRINENNGIIAIELETNKETESALKRFRALSDSKLRRIIAQHFVGWVAPATFNFLKQARRYKNIRRIVTVEPRMDGKFTEIDSDTTIAFESFKAGVTYATINPDGDILPEKLLRLYFRANKLSARQCVFRERTMIRTTLELARKNPDSDILLYCGYYHSAFIKDSLRKRGIAFVSRDTIRDLEAGCLNSAKTFAKSYRSLSRQELVELGRSAIRDGVWVLHKDITASQNRRLKKLLARRIRSMEDYRKAVSGFDVFVRKLYDSTK